jgi:hypothetical protein
MLRTLLYLGGSAFVACAFWILETSSSLQTCVAKQTSAQTEQAKENNHSPPFTLSTDDKVAIHARCAGHVIYENRDATTAVATAFIAFFTFTLWRSTNRLWRAGERQLAHFKDTAERQLRAYVYLDITLKPYPKPPQQPNRISVSLAIKNSGSTWARNLRSKHGKVVKRTVVDPFDFVKWDQMNPAPMVIGPSQSFSLQFPDVSSDELQEIIAGRLHIFFCGVDYLRRCVERPAHSQANAIVQSFQRRRRGRR